MTISKSLKILAAILFLPFVIEVFLVYYCFHAEVHASNLNSFFLSLLLVYSIPFSVMLGQLRNFSASILIERDYFNAAVLITALWSLLILGLILRNLPSSSIEALISDVNSIPNKFVFLVLASMSLFFAGINKAFKGQGQGGDDGKLT